RDRTSRQRCHIERVPELCPKASPRPPEGRRERMISGRGHKNRSKRRAPSRGGPWTGAGRRSGRGLEKFKLKLPTYDLTCLQNLTDTTLAVACRVDGRHSSHRPC